MSRSRATICRINSRSLILLYCCDLTMAAAHLNEGAEDASNNNNDYSDETIPVTDINDDVTPQQQQDSAKLSNQEAKVPEPTGVQPTPSTVSATTPLIDLPREDSKPTPNPGFHKMPPGPYKKDEGLA